MHFREGNNLLIILTKISSKYARFLLLEEVVGWFLWIPFFLAIGIGFFLCSTLKIHYNNFTLLLSILVLSLLYITRKYKKYTGTKILLWHLVLVSVGIITTILLGYFISSYRYYTLATPTLEQPIQNAMIIGRIINIEERENDHRLYLDQLTINQNLSQNNQSNTQQPVKIQEQNDSINVLKNINTVEFETDQLPLKQIRINTRYRHRGILQTGDYIRFKAQLMPPPKPTYPEGFDFGRHAYFKGIGAIGYATGNIYIIGSQVKDKVWQNQRSFDFNISSNEHKTSTFFGNFVESFFDHIKKVRAIISSRIRDQLSEPSSSIATGMLINEVSTISVANFNALRISGTAHLIAISGMHVVAVASIIFFIVYFVCSRFHSLTLKYNIKKIASSITIIAIWFYLLLSNAPVSAQRAVITATLFFIATLIDRNADPIVSLAVAAIIILAITPEMLLNPSLQMSFAACGSLILVFKYYKTKSTHNKPYWYQVKSYITKLTVASAAASAATSPFIAYHFHQISLYSIFANLICVPLADFVIMPMGLLSIMLIPFNLEALPLYLMDLGIRLLLWLAHFFADLPSSAYTGIYIGVWQVIAISASFYVLCVSITSQLKVVAAMVLFIATLSCFFITRQLPDLIISGNLSLFAINSTLLNRHESKLNNHETKNIFIPKITPKKENQKSNLSVLSTQLIFSSKSKERYSRITWQQILGENNFNKKAINKLYPNCNQTYCEFILLTKIGYEVCIINLDSEKILSIGNRVVLTRNDLETDGTYIISFKKDKIEMQNTSGDTKIISGLLP